MLKCGRLSLEPPQLEAALERFGNQKLRIQQDILDTKRIYNTLRLTQDTFVSNNGTSYLMLVFDGTIPISYRGAVYQIPVNIWIPDQYPMVPPICYVVPTKEMMLVPNHHCVDSSGLCLIPYLLQWRPEICNLVGFLYTLQAAFGAQPPVYSIPNSSLQTHSNYTSITPQGNSYTPPTTSVQQQAELPNPSTKNKNDGQDQRSLLVDKIKEKMVKFYSDLSSDVDKFTKIQAQLEKNEEFCLNIIKSFENEEKQLNNMMDILEQTEEQVVQWLSSNECKSLNIDEVVVPEDPLSQQMFDLVAEDATIEDTLYYLNRALESGALDVDSFLKAYRSLSREQFTKRAMCIKVFEAQHSYLLNNEGRKI